MWAQNWDALAPLMVDSSWDLDTRFLRKNYTVQDMVRHAEEFYASLGLPWMVRSFWTRSQLTKPENATHANCHAAAVDMFTGDDFRILMCAKPSLQDFYVVHHELGHIQYYMAYTEQPTIFQAGANSAFQESVGDAVMYGVLNPQHLERLGLVTASCNISEVELVLLMRSALNKLPQLGFSLAVDKWRWSVMQGEITPDNYNSAWWDLQVKYLGIRPPSPRSDLHFDAAAKSHVLENIPYIRYFLSGFLQMQILDAMCKASLSEEEDDQPISLHRCDIYGSLKAGERLRRMMRLGASVHWSQALLELTDGEYDFYSAKPLLKYYQPLSKWLDQQIKKYQIPVWIY